MDISVINAIFNKLKKPKADGGKAFLNQTLRGYISSVKQLIRFLKIHNEIDPSLTPSSLEILSESLTDLSVGLKRGVQIQNRNRESRVEQVLPTTSHLVKYLASDVRARTIIKIRETANGAQLTTTDMVLINGFIFCELSMDNANRRGEIISMTVRQFNKAKVDSDGIFTVYIKTHKTYYKYGEALISVNKDLVKLMTIYRDHIRCQLLKRCTSRVTPPNQFFLTSEGNYNMRRYMQAVWNKVRLPSQIGPTLMRKNCSNAHPQTTS